jgi:hypothetical protein
MMQHARLALHVQHALMIAADLLQQRHQQQQ